VAESFINFTGLVNENFINPTMLLDESFISLVELVGESFITSIKPLSDNIIYVLPKAFQKPSIGRKVKLGKLHRTTSPLIILLLYKSSPPIKTSINQTLKHVTDPKFNFKVSILKWAESIMNPKTTFLNTYAYN